MKILLCHNYYRQRGGEDESFAAEGRLLESRGHEVLYFTRHNNTISSLGWWTTATSPLWNRESGRDVWQLIAVHKPDVMHCTNTFPLISPSIYYAARRARVPVVQSLRNFRPLCVNGHLLRDDLPCEDCIGRRFSWPGVVHGCYRESRVQSAGVAAMQLLHGTIGTWTRAVDTYFVPSEHARTRFIAGGFPAERIFVKPNFNDEDPGVSETRSNYAAYAGRLSTEKGVETLLAAWELLEDDIELRVVGDGPLAPAVKAASERDPRIRFLGWQPRSEVLRIFSAAACIVVPSIWYETFGRAIIEAFTVGTPAIVSRLGAMEELVEDGRTGFHFQPGNARELAVKVSRLYRDPQCARQMRIAARREYETRYTADVNYDILQLIYREAIQHCRQSTTPGGGLTCRRREVGSRAPFVIPV